jgi:hypothetical protein
MHEDFVQEHGSPEGALRAFHADAGDDERRRLRADAKKLLEMVEDGELETVRELLAKLGAKWTPRSRAALVRWLQAAAKTDDRRA